MNKWFGMGRLTRDPKLESSGNGVEYCRFSIAVDRSYTKKDGGDRQTDFIDCTAFGKSAALIERYFHKGDGIAVEGRLETDKYVDKDGNNRTSWKIMVDRIEFPPSRKSADSGSSPAAPTLAEPTDGGDEEVPF